MKNGYPCISGYMDSPWEIAQILAISRPSTLTSTKLNLSIYHRFQQIESALQASVMHNSARRMDLSRSASSTSLRAHGDCEKSGCTLKYSAANNKALAPTKIPLKKCLSRSGKSIQNANVASTPNIEGRENVAEENVELKRRLKKNLILYQPLDKKWFLERQHVSSATGL